MKALAPTIYILRSRRLVVAARKFCRFRIVANCPPSYTSQVMRIYNLDYVRSVRSLLIYLVMSFLRNLLINLIVDDTKWKVGKNRAPPRSQSSVKQTALFNTIQTLISQGIVKKSQSPHYSQILMVPKPDGTFRMCVDYRALNDCTADASWPIPNIAEMLRRIGSQKQKIFGIMDLTQGYHQAPLTFATRAYTAFITFSGVYQFTRLPFGPK